MSTKKSNAVEPSLPWEEETNDPAIPQAARLAPWLAGGSLVTAFAIPVVNIALAAGGVLFGLLGIKESGRSGSSSGSSRAKVSLAIAAPALLVTMFTSASILNDMQTDTAARRAPDAELAAASQPQDNDQGADDQDLSTAPGELSEFARNARDRTVTIWCEVGGQIVAVGSGWPLLPESLGAAAVAPAALVITNAHVVDGCDEVIVESLGRRRYGEITGSQMEQSYNIEQRGARDLASIIVDLPLEPFTANSDVEIGHWVMVIGSPDGLQGTVTFGSIANDFDGILFYDAAISPGNSGGPLFNSRGEVVGISTWLFGEYGNLSGGQRVDLLCDRILVCY